MYVQEDRRKISHAMTAAGEAKKPRIAAPVTLADAFWEYTISVLAAIGFWHVAFPYIESWHFVYADALPFRVSPLIRWGVPIISCVIYVACVGYHLLVRLPRHKKLVSEGRAPLVADPKRDAVINTWLARWNMFLAALSFVMLVVRFFIFFR